MPWLAKKLLFNNHIDIIPKWFEEPPPLQRATRRRHVHAALFFVDKELYARCMEILVQSAESQSNLQLQLGQAINVES
jgi:hypothetical protein